jgi:hypothetical protein
MEEYLPYDEALEERIRADHEVQDIVDVVGLRSIAAWCRLRHWLIVRISIRRLHPES